VLVNKGYKSFDSVSFSFESVGYFGANIRLFWKNKQEMGFFFHRWHNNLAKK